MPVTIASCMMHCTTDLVKRLVVFAYYAVCY